jgi:hypothetical protein
MRSDDQRSHAVLRDVPAHHLGVNYVMIGQALVGEDM